MSKAKLIKLIKANDDDLYEWLGNVDLDEAREVFIQALKDQDSDTRHGCADALILYTKTSGVVSKIDAHAACMTYQDKGLAGL